MTDTKEYWLVAGFAIVEMELCAPNADESPAANALTLTLTAIAKATCLACALRHGGWACLAI
eukprot:3188031-Karenia_brevis.AAC.1